MACALSEARGGCGMDPILPKQAMSSTLLQRRSHSREPALRKNKPCSAASPRLSSIEVGLSQRQL